METNDKRVSVNRNLLILLILIQVIICRSITSQWYIQTTRMQLNSISFKSQTTGMAVGNNGIILRTTNAGNNWIFSSLNNGINFSSVTCMDNLTGWATGINTGTSSIYKTTNSGINWQTMFTSPAINSYNLNIIQFVTNQTGWAIGSKGKILKSTNGGNNWDIQTYSAGNDNLTSIYMVNVNTGWITSSTEFLTKKILKTTNGGMLWQLISSDTGQGYRKILFSDDNHGWILEDPWSILRTTNSGNNWTRIYHGIEGSTNSFYFTDSLRGWIVNSWGSIYRTDNGGQSWYQQKPAEGYWYQGNVLMDIFFINKDTGWACGGKSRVFKTTNGGINWVKEFNTIEGMLKSIKFVNNLTGWVVSNIGRISKTINGGIKWEPQISGSNSSLNSLDFQNELTGIAVGTSGTILRTTNAGINWIQDNSVTALKLNSIDMLNNGTGYICGNSGFICRTTNNGVNWITLNSETSKNLYSICFTSDNMCWAAGDSIVLKTTDSGNNWEVKMSDFYKYNMVQFVNPRVGWLICNKVQAVPPPFGSYIIRKILKTLNGGESWDTVYSQSNVNSNFIGLSFSDSVNGWITSNTSEILRTTNGGTSFSNSNTSLYQSLYSVYAYSSQFAWIASDSGTVYSTYNGNTIGINSYNSEVPVLYNLFQNYPNPFNPTTKITFALPFKSFITLKVYDLLGREIETLVNTSLNVGKYDVVFNASNLASGVYFYRIESERFSETKKMIVLK